MEDNNNKNIELWTKVETTDPNKTKEVNFGGNKYTAIDPYYRIKKATEIFGIYGEKWGFSHANIKEIPIDSETWIAKFHGIFFYEYGDKKGEFPVVSSSKIIYKTNGDNGYVKIDDDYAKKIYTDALTKALSYLGFNADIFMGKFEDDKYVAKMKELSQLVSEGRLTEIEFIVNVCEDKKELKIKFDLLEPNERVDKDVLEIFGKKRVLLEKKTDADH